ncbi:MAG TPA: putative Ig domain-containing protein [Terriglobales bacterium]|nr:putative Ig domain-containing protein [Terriglobales bacterium]
MKVWSLSLIAILFAAGCGGGSSPGTGGGIGGIEIQVTSPSGAAAVDSGLALPITVQVNGDSSNAGVIWSVAAQEKGKPAGALSDVKPTSVTYNPPDGISSATQVTVTATSVTDPTRSLAIPISVYPALATVTPNLATAFVNTDFTCIQTPITSAGVIQIPCQLSVTGGLAPFTWSVDITTLPPGLFLGPGLTANDTKIIGQPSASGVYPFTATVSDSLGAKTSTLVTINVAPQQLKVVTPTLLTTTQGIPYAPVVLQVSGGVPPYTWGLALGSASLPPGMTLSPTGVISGTPTTNSAAVFALQVTDSQSPVPAQAVFPTPAASNAKVMTLAPSGLDPTCIAGGSSVLPGTPYAFLISGFDADGPVTISGSFTADASGNLSGVEDIIRNSGAQTGLGLAAGSSIVFNQAGRGCLTLNSAASSATFLVAPTTISGGAGAAFFPVGRIMEFDDNDGTGTRASGLFRVQDPSAFSNTSLSGPFAYRLAGWDSAGGRLAIAGIASANDGNLTSLSADFNDGGTLTGPITGGSGALHTTDVNGRGTATLGIGSQTYELTYYIVDAGHLLFNSTQPADSGHPIIAGEATATAGSFSPTSLNHSHIFRLSGRTPGSPDAAIGVIHFDGTGGLSGTMYERNGGTPSTTTLSGVYSIDGTSGRFTFSGTGVPAIGYAIPGTGGVTGYLVGTTPSAASGVLEFQTDSYPPGYQFSPLIGRYGIALDEMLDRQTTGFIGQEGADGNGGLTSDSYIDTQRASAPGLVPVQAFTMFRYTWNAEGTGTFGGNTYMVTNGDKTFYIDLSPANGHPAVVVGQRQQAP